MATVRRVRTPEGARFYQAPIGTPIQAAIAGKAVREGIDLKAKIPDAGLKVLADEDDSGLSFDSIGELIHAAGTDHVSESVVGKVLAAVHQSGQAKVQPDTKPGDGDKMPESSGGKVFQIPKNPPNPQEDPKGFQQWYEETMAAFHEAFPSEKPDNPAADKAASVQVKRATEADKVHSPKIAEAMKAGEGTPQGWDYRIKGAGSTARKLHSKSKDGSVDLNDPESVNRRLSDSLRYTVTWDSENFLDGLAKTVAALKEQGFDVQEVENDRWHEALAGYKGVHIDLVTEDGLRIEFQAHTHDSYARKDVGHGLYEMVRHDSVAPESKKAVQLSMDQWWDKLEVPGSDDENYWRRINGLLES